MDDYRPSPPPEDAPQVGSFGTLRLLRKGHPTEFSTYPIDGESVRFGRDVDNDVRIYYKEVSRFHCELVFDGDSQASLHIKGSAGVEVNGHLVLPPNVVRLNDLDVVTIRKKDFQLVLPLPEERVIRSKVSTPRRARPSQRLSLLPKDLLFSPYAEKDAQAAARLQSPLKPVARHQPSALTAAPSALSASFVAAREGSEEASEEDEAMESEEQQLNDAPQAELDQEVESGEEEKEDQADNLSSEEDEEKENTPIAGTQKAAVPASRPLPCGFMTPQPVRPTHPRAQQATSAAPRSRIIQVKKIAPPVMREAVSSEEEESEVDEEEKEQVEEAQGEEEEQDEADDEERMFNDDAVMASCDEGRSEVENAEAEPMAQPPKTPASIPHPEASSSPYSPLQSIKKAALSFLTKAPPATPSTRGHTVDFAEQTPPAHESSGSISLHPATPIAATRMPNSVPLPPSDGTPYAAPVPGTPVPAGASSSRATPKTPRFGALPASAETPYTPAPETSQQAPAATPTRKATTISQTPNAAPASVRKGGPNSLRKAILLRSAKKILRDDERRREFEQRAEMTIASDEEEEKEEDVVQDTIDPAQVPLPESPSVGGYTSRSDTPSKKTATSLQPAQSVFDGVEDSDSEMEGSDSEMEDSDSEEDAAAEEEQGQETDFEGGDLDKGVAEEDAIDPQNTVALRASLPGIPFAVTPRSSTGTSPFQIRGSAPFTSITVDDHFFSEDEDSEEVERSLIEEEENSEVNDDADAEGMVVDIEEAEEGDGDQEKEDWEEEDEDASDVDEDVVDPASIPLPATPQAILPSARAFYTPQVSQPASHRENLMRTMGPPVRVAAPSPRPALPTAHPRDHDLDLYRRSSLGAPIRAPKTRVVEEEDEEPQEEEQEPSRQDSMSSILASAPRQLSKIPDFNELYSSPRKLMQSTVSKDTGSSSSDEETSTPLKSLAKKAEQLRRKSIARPSVGGFVTESPAGATTESTPLRRIATPLLQDSPLWLFQSPARSALGTPAPSRPLSLLKSQLCEVTESPAIRSNVSEGEMNSDQVAKAEEKEKEEHAAGDATREVASSSRSAARQEPPTPYMRDIKHLYPSNTLAATPRFSGMKQMFQLDKEDTSTLATPRLGGVRDMFQLPAQPSSTPKLAGVKQLFQEQPEMAATPKFAGIRELLRTPSNQPTSSLDAHFTGVPTLFASHDEEHDSPSRALSDEDLGIQGFGMEAELARGGLELYEPEDIYDDEAEQAAAPQQQSQLEEATEDPGKVTEEETAEVFKAKEVEGEPSRAELSPKPAPRRATRRAASIETTETAVVAPSRRTVRSALKAPADSFVEEQEKEESQEAPAPKARAIRSRKAAAPKVAPVHEPEAEPEDEESAPISPPSKATRTRKITASTRTTKAAAAAAAASPEPKAAMAAEEVIPIAKTRRAAPSFQTSEDSEPVPVSKLPVRKSRATTSKAAAASIEFTSPTVHPRIKMSSRSTKRTASPASTEGSAVDPIDSIGPDESTTPAPDIMRATKARRTVAAVAKQDDESEPALGSKPKRATKATSKAASTAAAAAVEVEEAVEAKEEQLAPSSRKRTALKPSAAAPSRTAATTTPDESAPKRRRAAAAFKAVAEEHDNKENAPEQATPVTTTSRAKTVPAASKAKAASATKATRKTAALTEDEPAPAVTRSTRSRK